MSRVEWDIAGARIFEVGVDRGMLYVTPFPGIAWNGLIRVTESPTGGAVSEYFVDGLKSLNVPALEEYSATIEAFSSPKEFAPCAGLLRLSSGLFASNQPRKQFGFSYRTLIGSDTLDINAGYKIHVVYNARTKTSDVAHHTFSDRPEISPYSWEITTVPETVPGYRPAAHFVIDSRRMDPGVLGQLEDILYGSSSTNPRLPEIEELVLLTTAGYQTGTEPSYADLRMKKMRIVGIGAGISRVSSAPIKMKKMKISGVVSPGATQTGKIDLLPYLIASGAVGTGATTLTMTVGDGGGWPVLGGDEIIIAGGSGGALPTGITDQQGNTYTQRVGTATTPSSSIWTAKAGANGLKAPMTGFTTGTQTITYTGTGQAKQWIAMGCKNLGARDKLATPTTGTSTAPSISSGTLAEAGELVVAVVLHANAGGTINTPAGWHVIAKNITSGVNALASMFVKIATSTASVTFTGTLTASAAWTAEMLTYKAALVDIKGKVGGSIFSGAYPGLGLSNMEAHQRFDSVTGRNNAAIKRYCSEHDSTGWAGPGNDEEGIVGTWAAFDQVVCVKPRRAVGGGTAAALAGLKTSLTYWRNNNLDLQILIGNEPNVFGQHGPFGDGTNKDWNMDSPYGAVADVNAAAQNYKDHFGYYGPTVISAGYQCGFNATINAETASLLFTPSRLQSDGWPLCSHISIDVYFTSDYLQHGTTLDATLNAADAMSPRCPVGISEMGASNSSIDRPLENTPAGSLAGLVTWLDNEITAKMAARPAAGKKNMVVVWYAAGTANSLDFGQAGGVIAAWQRLYDALNP
jgi:hypothetical protein